MDAVTTRSVTPCRPSRPQSGAAEGMGTGLRQKEGVARVPVCTGPAHTPAAWKHTAASPRGGSCRRPRPGPERPLRRLKELPLCGALPLPGSCCSGRRRRAPRGLAPRGLTCVCEPQGGGDGTAGVHPSSSGKRKWGPRSREKVAQDWRPRLEPAQNPGSRIQLSLAHPGFSCGGACVFSCFPFHL